MDEYVTDLRCRYEACVTGEEVGGGEGACLYAEGAEGQEGFLYLSRKGVSAGRTGELKLLSNEYARVGRECGSPQYRCGIAEIQEIDSQTPMARLAPMETLKDNLIAARAEGKRYRMPWHRVPAMLRARSGSFEVVRNNGGVEMGGSGAERRWRRCRRL